MANAEAETQAALGQRMEEAAREYRESQDRARSPAVMASMEAKTRAFLESQGHAWPAAPDPLLLDGPLRRCCAALGRFAAHPTYFNEVPHVAILPTEASKLSKIVKQFAAMAKRPGNFAKQSMLIFEATSRLTGEVVHVRAIIERPKKDAWNFCVDWKRCFGYEWPKVGEFEHRP